MTSPGAPTSEATASRIPWLPRVDEQAVHAVCDQVGAAAGREPDDGSATARTPRTTPGRCRADVRGEYERPVTASHQLVDQVRDRDGDGLLGWWEVSGHDGRSHAPMLTGRGVRPVNQA